MARSEAKKRAVRVVQEAARQIIDEIDKRPDSMIGTEFAAMFHFDCTAVGPIEKNWMETCGRRRPARITHTIFKPVFGRQ